jgi:RNA-directed DNA polymerase
MKRFGNLWESIVSFENLYEAWRLARRGKRYMRSTLDLSFDIESELFSLREQLASGTYEPGPYLRGSLP